MLTAKTAIIEGIVDQHFDEASFLWTLRDAAERLNEVNPDLQLSHGTLHHIETDGTTNIKIIRAFSELYDTPMVVIERGMDAVKNSRKNLQEVPVLA